MFKKIKDFYKNYKYGKEFAKKYDEASNLLGIGIVATLLTNYLQGMNQREAPVLSTVLASQVANYFKGYDINRIIQESEEPLKSQITTIKDMISNIAFRLMDKDHELRELVVHYLIFQRIMGRQHEDKGYREDFTDIEKEQVDFILEKYASHNTPSRIDDIDKFLLLVNNFYHDRVRQYEETTK